MRVKKHFVQLCTVLTLRNAFPSHDSSPRREPDSPNRIEEENIRSSSRANEEERGSSRLHFILCLDTGECQRVSTINCSDNGDKADDAHESFKPRDSDEDSITKRTIWFASLCCLWMLVVMSLGLIQTALLLVFLIVLGELREDVALAFTVVCFLNMAARYVAGREFHDHQYFDEKMRFSVEFNFGGRTWVLQEFTDDALN